MPFPSDSGTLPTNMVGTTQLADATDDHALMHRQLGTVLNAVTVKIGLPASTPAANQILVGSGSGTAQWGSIWNNSTLGTPIITGGTINNSILGTPVITGGTANSQTLGTPTLQGTVVNTANIADAAVTERKIKMDQLAGTTFTSGTTASQTKVDITGGSVTINLNVASNVLINFSAANSNTGGVPTLFTLLTDGTADSTWNDVGMIDPTSPGAASFQAWRTGLSSGTHNWRMQWRTSGVGTLSLTAFELIVIPFSQ